MLDNGIIAFVNNILIYSNGSKQEYEIFICKVLNHLLKYELYVVIDKYKF